MSDQKLHQCLWKRQLVACQTIQCSGYLAWPWLTQNQLCIPKRPDIISGISEDQTVAIVNDPNFKLLSFANILCDTSKSTAQTKSTAVLPKTFSLINASYPPKVRSVWAFPTILRSTLRGRFNILVGDPRSPQPLGVYIECHPTISERYDICMYIYVCVYDCIINYHCWCYYYYYYC